MSTARLRMNGRGCRALTHQEFEAILGGMAGRYALRNRVLFVLLRYTGFRISEALSLKLDDVFDYVNREVRETITVDKSYMKGGKRSRTMPVHPRLREELAMFIQRTNLDFIGFHEWQLFHRQGRNIQLTPAMAWGILQFAADDAGVDTRNLGTHSMRKTFATAVYHHPQIGGNLLKVAQLLGHDDVKNTARYVEFLDGSLEDAVMAQ